MSSNNYAEQGTAKPEEILADLRRGKTWYLAASNTSESAWGKYGMDIQSLEASDSKVTSHTAEALFTVATEKYDVDFGNGEYGYCFQIGEKYFWLAPVEKANYGEPKR